MPRWTVPVVALAVLAIVIYEALGSRVLEDLNLPPYAFIVFLVGFAVVIGVLWAIFAAIRGRREG